MTEQPARLPYWLGADIRAALRSACEQAVAADTKTDADTGHLADVLVELAVAAARDTAWPAGSDTVRQAAGWGPDVLPIRMSPEETAAVLRHVHDPTVRTALSAPARAGQL